MTRLDLNTLPDDQKYLFVHRSDLIDLLATAVRDAGVSIRLLQKVDYVVPGARPQVHMVTGDQLSADLVVGADGVKSRIRAV